MPELMKLKDKDVFLETIRGVNVLLFGHLHHNQRFSTDEIEYDINCIQLTGGSTHGLRIDWTEIDTLNYKTLSIVY